MALDGRIEPGDMILQVNDRSFENMSNDDAVRVLVEECLKDVILLDMTTDNPDWYIPSR